MLKWTSIAIAILLIATAITLKFQPTLQTIHQDIVKNYQGLEHLDAQQFSELDSSQTIVFDIREEGEFEVSHLPNAIWVPPDLDAQEFIADYGDVIAGKQAVFYCSVGRRSSEFAQRVQQQNTNLKIANLERGLFNWVNENRQVVGEGIHPYNAYWGRLIKDKNKINYQAKGSVE